MPSRLPATLGQRLAALSGRATIANLPDLYGRFAPDADARTRGIGGPPGLQGEPAAQQLTALDAASGGAAPGGGSPGGGFSSGFPDADAVAAPGRTNGRSLNTLRQYFGGAGRSEGGGYGGGAGGIRDREADMVDRGYTSSWGGFADSLSNAFGLMGPGVVTTGFKTMAEQGFGLPQGTLGGIGDVRGYSAFDADIIDAVKSGRMRMGQAVGAQAARDEAKQALAADSSRRVGRGYGGPSSRGRNALRGAYGGAYSGGFGRGGGDRRAGGERAGLGGGGALRGDPGGRFGRGE